MAKPERNVSGELLALPFVSDEPCALRVDDALGFDPFRQTTCETVALQALNWLTLARDVTQN